MDDFIYFGARRVRLARVPGEAVAYVSDAWCVDNSDAALSTTLARAQPLPAAKDGPANVVVPGIPAREIVPCSTCDTGVQAWPEALRRPLLKVAGMDADDDNDDDCDRDRDDEGADTFVRKRCARQPGLHAVASGVRSALVKVGERWYRLKGAGNHSDGFILRTAPPQSAPSAPASQASTSAGAVNRETATLTLRGCAFMHTAARELFMTSRIASVLARHGVRCANYPLGYYVYAPPHCPLGTETADMVPVCIIAETFGDRRLGTHVLGGLDLLLPLLIDSKQLEIDPVALASLFPAARPGLPSGVSAAAAAAAAAAADGGAEGGNPQDLDVDIGGASVAVGPALLLSHLGSMPATAELMYDHKVRTLAPAELRDAMSTYGDVAWSADTLGFVAAEPQPSVTHHVPEEAPDPTTFPEQCVNAGVGAGAGQGHGQHQANGQNFAPMGERWRELWTTHAQRLRNALRRLRPGSSVLGYVFSRLGFECGRFLRLLHQERVSWGTYQDRMCRVDWDEWHCNAHANNMVLLPKQCETDGSAADSTGTSEHNFLGFLDLDMAFDEQSFVNLRASSPAAAAQGVLDKDEHRAYFDRLLERERVELLEVLAGGDSTSGVPAVAMDRVAGQGPAMHALRAALYDTLALGYMRGYRVGDDRVHDDSSWPVAQYDEALHEAAYCVLKLAVCIMGEFVV